jgi:hypothetical protein
VDIVQQDKKDKVKSGGKGRASNWEHKKRGRPLDNPASLLFLNEQNETHISLLETIHH